MLIIVVVIEMSAQRANPL